MREKTQELLRQLYRRTGTTSPEELAKKHTLADILPLFAEVFGEQFVQMQRTASADAEVLRKELEQFKKTFAQQKDLADTLVTLLAARDHAFKTSLTEDRQAYVGKLEEQVADLTSKLQAQYDENIAVVRIAGTQARKRLEHGTTVRILRKENTALEAKLALLNELPRTQAGTAMDAKLRRLYNAHTGCRLLEEAIDKMLLHGEPLSVAFCDLDKFHEYDEAYRHIQGDRALFVVEDVLAQSHRASDIVFRLGGDEFAIILPNTPGDAAFNKLNTLRERISKRDVPYVGDPADKDKHYFVNRSYKHITISGAVTDVRKLDMDALRAHMVQSNNAHLAQIREEAREQGISEETKIQQYVDNVYKPLTLGESIIQYLSHGLKAAKKNGRDIILLIE